jgi:hypothetical protein
MIAPCILYFKHRMGEVSSITWPLNSHAFPSEYEITFHNHNKISYSTSIKLCDITRVIYHSVTLYEDCSNETSLGIALGEGGGAIRNSLHGA